MSRIAKNSIKIPEGTSCNFDNNVLTVKGKNGENTLKFNDKYTIKNENNEIFVLPITEDGKVKFDMENDIIKGCLVTHKGNIIHEMTKNIIEGEK